MNISSLSNAYSTAGIAAQGMDAVSGASGYVPPPGDQLAALRADIKQNSEDFKALRTALRGGNLSDSLNAYGSLSQDIQNASRIAGQSLFATNSPIGKDFKAIGQALQSGDLSGAKQAFQAFARDVRTAHRARQPVSPINDGDSDEASTPSSNASVSIPISTSSNSGLDATA
jgi:hypothetical protein